MSIEKILNEVYPLTLKQKTCRIEKQIWDYKRKRLREMIEAYGRGEIVNFEPLKVSVDLSEILKKYEN